MRMRARLRDLGLTVGRMAPGPHNAITDVPGVLVGHATVVADEPRVARTGVTVVMPRGRQSWTEAVFGGYFSFNGCGEMTGIAWLEESGMLGTPIAITGTASVGAVWDALTAYGFEHGYGDAFLPVVAETHDGHLSDLAAFHVGRAHVDAAIAAAAGGPVAEGCVGGGTGMICHEFKGGIGTASRVAPCRAGSYTVGALVQANYGERALLRVDGAPVGREIGYDRVPGTKARSAGSIIVVVATDAPLLPTQCARLARRATVGLARVGGTGHNGSGDIFLAFSTGNTFPVEQPADALDTVQMLRNEHMDPLFEATAEAVEEAILNALTAAETTAGFRGHVAHAIPLDELAAAVARYGRR